MSDDARISAFVARNTDYYRNRWRKFHEKPGAITSFNIAACIGQVIWLAYRKLYVPLFWTFVVCVAYVSLSIYVEEKQLISEDVSSAWHWFVSILFFAVFGFLGNYWYWRKFRRVERRAASREWDETERLQFLRSKGGTSPLGAWLVVIVMLAPVAWGLYWGVYQASRYDFSQYVFDAKGPLTLSEFQTNFFAFMDRPLVGPERDCVFREVEERARVAGDPETLDPQTVEFLPETSWHQLDSSDKRLILMQAIATKAFFVCKRAANRGAAELPVNPDYTRLNGATEFWTNAKFVRVAKTVGVNTLTPLVPQTVR